MKNETWLLIMTLDVSENNEFCSQLKHRQMRAKKNECDSSKKTKVI